MKEINRPEPWLRGGLSDVPAVPRAALHALELAREDLNRWCGSLSDEQLHARPAGIAPVAFHIRHIAGSVDRLLTYAEGRTLGPAQLMALSAELDPGATKEKLFSELAAVWEESARRIRRLASLNLEEARTVGSKHLPTSLGGLLVHIADHTQRHVGQAITTAKIVVGGRS